MTANRDRPDDDGLPVELKWALFTDDELTDLLLAADSEEARDTILHEIERRRSIFR